MKTSPIANLLVVDVLLNLHEVAVLVSQWTAEIMLGLDEPLSQSLHASFKLRHSRQRVFQFVQSAREETECFSMTQVSL
jgi:hypothetical protein